ncbi:hypothetical protein, partial [Bacillus thuringiensis]|uniref:hypothetical protein n=1 Tax=Bacillus thuringiensis TaxID=1428 RepID=UPI00197A88BF
LQISGFPMYISIFMIKDSYYIKKRLLNEQASFLYVNLTISMKVVGLILAELFSIIDLDKLFI